MKSKMADTAEQSLSIEPYWKSDDSSQYLESTLIWTLIKRSLN